MVQAKKRFLLIFPHPISEMPTSFAYLSAVLRQKGFDVKAVVNTFNRFLEWDDFVKIANDYQPTVVGLNVGTFSLLKIYETIGKIKKMGFPVIAGGSHATSCPDEVINNGVDIVVRNEGEITLAELCDYWDGKEGLSLDSIPGISFKDRDGRIIHNPARKYLPDLSQLPTPDFSSFDYDCFRTSDGLLKGLHRIYCSRGCPAGCAFCDRAVFGQSVRYRPVKDVVEEIRFRRDNYNIESFVIADDTFTFSKNYVRSFCQALKDYNLNIIWGCSTRADVVDSGLMALMKDAGCYLMNYGIESGDPDTLKLANKGITLEQAHLAVDEAAKYGFRIYVNLMTGFPWENETAVINNIKYIKQHFDQVYMYQVSGALVPYPGTTIYHSYKDKYDFKEWWLRPEYQSYGIQIHQNSQNPYKHSTFYQRKLYDDTYIWEERFFPYTRQYKKYVKEMAFLIGKRNLVSLYSSRLRRALAYNMCKVSRLIYELNPKFEKTVVSGIFSAVHFQNRFHDRGPLGYLRKKN